MNEAVLHQAGVRRQVDARRHSAGAACRPVASGGGENPRMDELDVRMLGGFEVRVNGHPLPEGAFAQRRAADLVKILALAPGHRLSRDRVVELLWPRLAADAGTANLHKAAHYARRALDVPDAVVLRQGLVELCSRRRGDDRRRALRGRRRLRRRAAPRRPLRGVGAGDARAPARAPPRGAAARAALGRASSPRTRPTSTRTGS